METDELKSIVEQSVARDTDAFRVLYDHLIDKVHSYMSFRTGDETSAMDITQDVFIDLYTALKNFSYHSDKQFYSFVFVIAKRKLAAYYEKRSIELEHRVDQENEDVLPADTQDITESDAVKRALNTLPKDTQEIIVLHHWSRYTFPEIASLLEMTESAVRVRHHRALQTLSLTLSEDYA